MSTPRSFGSIPDVLRACKEHGFFVSKLANGHWQIRDRSGNPNRVVAVFPGTSSLTHRLFMNQVSQIKRLTGVDIRISAEKEDKPKPAESVPAPRLSVSMYTPVEQEFMRMKDAVREVILELLGKLLPRPEPEAKPEPPPPPPTQPATVEKVKGKRYRAPNLTPEKMKEISDLYDSGESIADLAKAFGVHQSTISNAYLKARGKRATESKGRRR